MDGCRPWSRRGRRRETDSGHRRHGLRRLARGAAAGGARAPGAGAGAAGEQAAGTGGRSRCRATCATRSRCERAVAGCGLVFHVAADYRLWARDPRRDVPLQRGRHAQPAGGGAAGGRGAGGLHQHGGLHRHFRRAASATKRRPVALADMTGDYKRSKFLAEQVALEFARDGFPGGDREPHRAGGRSRLQADADRQDHPGFSEAARCRPSSIPA